MDARLNVTPYNTLGKVKIIGVQLRSVSKSKANEKWLRDLGKHIESLIKKKGYSSPYDFWVNKAGDHISRATLNYILAGKSDPKATTLRTLAKLLGVTEAALLDF